MRSRISKILALGLLTAQGPLFAQSFTRLQLNTQFYSEGIVAADLNKDGVVDILAGPYWYPGPSFQTKLAFRTPRATPFATSGDSDCYALFVSDFNGDGWPDILSFRTGGGAEAVWYQNPGNPSASTGVWTERLAYGNVDSESPAFVDVNGDGRPEIVTTSARYGGWVTFDPANPNAAWTFRSVTAQGPGTWDQFTHGTGAGDVNGDGRVDLLFPEGWWEQPAASTQVPWTHHAVPFWGQELAGEGYGGAQMHVYDVDGDGDNDVVTSLQAHGWGLAWFENQNGAFTKRMILNTRADTALYGAAFPQLHAVALADLDGDGLKDIVTGKRKGAHGNGLSATELNAAPVLYWFKLTRPAGQPPRFEPRLIDSASGIGTQITVADVNGDGRPDILTAARQGAFVFLNQMAVSTRRGWGPGFTPPFRGDFVPVDRDAAGRKRPEEACRECLAP
jgi:hypothetical protein